MKKVLEYAAAIAITFAVIGVSILLPQEISAFQDAKIIGQVHLEKLEESETGYHHQISVIKKIKLLENGRNVSATPLNQGRELTRATAIDKCADALNDLKKLKLFPQVDIETEVDFSVVNAFLLINTDFPSENIIIWRLYYSGKVGGTICLDDETGKILMLTAQTNDKAYLSPFTEEVAVKWGTYLGLDLADAKLSVKVEDASKKTLMTSATLTAVYKKADDELNYIIWRFERGCTYGGNTFINGKG